MDKVRAQRVRIFVGEREGKRKEKKSKSKRMNPRTTPSTATLSAADFFKCCVLLFCCFRFCSFLEPGPIWVNNCLTEHLRNKHENIHMCLGSVVSSLSWDPSSRHWRLDGRSFGENKFFGSFDAVVFSDAMTARRGSPGHCLLTGLEQSGKSLPPFILKPPPPLLYCCCLFTCSSSSSAANAVFLLAKQLSVFCFQRR